MKITINTTTKTVSVEEAVSLSELTDMIKRMFPEDHQNWKVEAPTKIQLTKIFREGNNPWNPGPLQPYWLHEAPNPAKWEITC